VLELTATGFACLPPGGVHDCLAEAPDGSVRFSEEHQPLGDGLAATVLAGDDGSRLVGPAFFDLRLGDWLQLQRDYTGTAVTLTPWEVGNPYYRSSVSCTLDLCKGACVPRDVRYVSSRGQVLHACVGTFFAQIACNLLPPNQCGEVRCPFFPRQLLPAVKTGTALAGGWTRPATEVMAGAGRFRYPALEVGCGLVPLGGPFDDTALGAEPCEPRDVGDGGVRCLPAFPARVAYLDPQCTQPVAATSLLDSTVAVSGPAAWLYGDPTPPTGYFSVPAADGGTFSTLYWRALDGGCEGTTKDWWRPLGAALPPDTFGSLDLQYR